MKRGISLIILLLCALCLQAQSDLTWIRTKEGRMVAVPKRAVFDLNLPKFTYKSFTPSDRQLIEAKLREFIPDLPVQSAYEQERPMDMIISSAAYQPFFNPYTPMLRRVSPMALDFHEVSVVPISEQVAFITSGQQYTIYMARCRRPYPDQYGTAMDTRPVLPVGRRFRRTLFHTVQSFPPIHGRVQCDGQL